MNYKNYAEDLISKLETHNQDMIIDKLIELGEQNIFIPTMIEVYRMLKAQNKTQYIKTLEVYINAAYSPGLRAHILDDFIREKLKLQNALNELKAQHHIYTLEQKLYMYQNAEETLRSTSILEATQAIMKVIEFRGDKK